MNRKTDEAKVMNAAELDAEKLETVSGGLDAFNPRDIERAIPDGHSFPSASCSGIPARVIPYPDEKIRRED